MSEVVNLKMNLITSNPYQPRVEFDEESLGELADSIRENGLIQPIVVRKKKARYQIVAGERRFKACQSLGWEEIPAIVVEAEDREMAQLALVENIQRESLSPIEEAKAYKTLLELNDMTQQELAQQLGKTQPAIANKMRLLNLAPIVQKAINSKVISERHGRAMLSLQPRQQRQLLKKILKSDFNVKETEKYIDRHYTKKPNEDDEEDDDDFIGFFGVSTRIALQTIRDAVKSLKKANVPVEMSEQEDEDNYIFTITVKK